MAWPDSGTNEVTKTIGATGRNHSTIAAWEADTDDDCTAGWGAGDYASPCSPVGECYDDGDLAVFYIEGATTSENYYRRLTVAAGQRHDGTNGDGVNIAGGGNISINDTHFVMEWTILSGTFYVNASYYTAASSRFMGRMLLLAGSVKITRSNPGAGALHYLDTCISHSTNAQPIRYIDYVRNCSVYATGAYAILDGEVTNCISIGASTNCFYNCTGSNNISGDTSAPGDDCIKSVASSIFASVGSGTEDLHLASGSTDADGAGVAISGLTTDIDGDAYTDPPDIGADQYVAAGGGISIPVVMHHRRMIGVA